MELNKLQLRSIPTGLAVREGEESRTIEGHAVVVNQETTLWECADYREIEVIDPACLNEAFMAEQDVKLNLLHERDTSIARSNKGVGNLKLDVREDGLHFQFDAPKCDLGDRALELVREGVYTGCSFEFYPKDYEISEREGADGKTEYLIRHKAFESMTAVTIAMDPAYKQTSVSAREEYQREHPANDEIDFAKREAEKQEREAKLAQDARQRERDIYLMTLNSK